MTDIDRPEGRLATVTAFPGTFDPTDTETDENPESAGELAKRAENIAMYALTRRAVSIREMEKLLKSRDLPDDVVATEIARLEGVGLLDDYALATRLALFLWNSPPDAALRARAARGELGQPAVLRAETERLLADDKSRRFREAFLDYWVDLRKIEDSTPSTTLYNDYYLDDALVETLEARGKEREGRFRRELLDDRLRQRASLRRERDHRPVGQCFAIGSRQRRRDDVDA